MRTDNMNEQAPVGTKQTRNGSAIDDKSKALDFSEGGQAPAAEVDLPAVSEKSGVAVDDKSKSFDA